MAKRLEEVLLIPLNQIVNKFDVRIALDTDRVVQFAEMYENGVDLPPVRLLRVDNTDPVQYAYVDGRHRGAAREFLDLKDVPAVMVDPKLNDDPVELYGQALEANYGGAKPPTREDIIHTVLRMLEAGCSRTSIAERLSFIPKGALRALMASALGTLSKRKITKALDLISTGSNVETAAKAVSIKPETLKDVIAGKKGKWGKNRSNEVELATQLKSHISVTLRSANTSISKKIEDLLRKVNDGDISPDTAQEVVDAWADHLRKTSVRVKDWSARVQALAVEHQRSAS